MFTPLIEKLVRREDLTADEASAAMQHVMDGAASPAALAGLLSALAMKGERPAEIVGFARTMRANAVKLASGAFRFSFVNVPGATFTAVTATNIESPRTTWTALGRVTEIAGGQYQFTDSVNTNAARRFYSVRQP